MGLKVLLIGKDASTLSSLKPGLEKKGYIVSAVRSRKKALEQVADDKPDLIILDATSPRLDGGRTCQALRQRVGEVPIILISEEGNDSGQAEADFHLTAPFTFRKLANRIKRVVQSSEQSGETLQVGGLILNLDKRSVSRGKKKHQLTPKELRLLEVFMRNPGKVLSRKFLMKNVWETDYVGDTRTLDVHVRWIREKIEENPSSPAYLCTVRGVGYRFEVPEQT
ncbi:MAG TPA: response regulator transcription factor [Anaerolineae bacterium]|nr:response regulator transcription factor [Anaerolineae bacterium]